MRLPVWFGLKTIRVKIFLLVALPLLIGQGFIVGSHLVHDLHWRQEAALEINRVLTDLLTARIGPALERNDVSDLRPLYEDVAINGAESEIRATIAALGIFDRQGTLVESFISPEHAGLETASLALLQSEARRTGRTTHRREGELHFYGVPIFTTAARDTPIGGIAVAWNNASPTSDAHISALTHATLSMLGFVAVLGLLLMSLRGIVLVPIAHLTDHVLDVTRSGVLREKQSAFARRRDEIGVLFREFDRMMSQLAEARHRLLEQSYYTGMAEAAAGVLHNLRNALNPMAVAAWKMRETVEEMSIRHMDTALLELASDETASDRRDRLVHYVRQATDKLLSSRTSIIEQADLVTSQIGQIERILQSFNQAGERSRDPMPIDLRGTVEDASRLLNKGSGTSVRLEIDESVDRTPSVRGHAVIIGQILGNLLVNAEEASAGVSDAVIRISAEQRHEASGPMLCIRVVDNGCGIAPTVMPRIFERGFSTRMRQSGGIGLHWCANSALAMGGRLEAHSDGIGTGARFELWLPVEVAPSVETSS